MTTDFPDHTTLLSYSFEELRQLCAKLREEIINSTARNGGHLASSLGTVELCVALHKHFRLNGPDAVFFDVGHQAYAHKLLTGRGESFNRLRQCDGCSGFPSPEESPYDPVIAGHAGVAISQALGASCSLEVSHTPGKAIAVVGDGSISCGISWEGMNNLPGIGKRLVIILNDNQMSISPNAGALRKCLNRIISGRFYNRIRRVFSNPKESHDGFFHRILRKIEHSLKGLFLPDGIIFQELGCRYFGPIDGNNIKELDNIFSDLPSDRPVLIHIVTRKGQGYAPAERSPEQFHGIAPFDKASGKTTPAPSAPLSYSAACTNGLIRLARQHKELAVISAAMLGGTGLNAFAKEFPERCFDVGIAEAHAVAFASGLATQNMHPVVVLYSTFLQRALDNVLHDVCLNNLPVIFCIDRTGAVPDGPTHHGLYALPFLKGVPNLTILSPADDIEMTQMLDYAWELKRPVIIRYPRGKCIQTIHENFNRRPEITTGAAWVIKDDASANLTIWSVGAQLAKAWEVARILESRHSCIHVRIVNARFILPFDTITARCYADTPQVVIDDYTSIGGLTSCLKEALFDLDKHAPLWNYTWPDNQILSHGEIDDLCKMHHLTVNDIVSDLEKRLEL